LLRSCSNVVLEGGESKVYDHDGLKDSEGVDVTRELTKLEREVLARHDAAEALIATLSKTAEDPTQTYMPSMLSDALFCGHLVTDMDSIAGALGAADLYGGKACRASEVNSETLFCLERWGVAQPPPIEEMLVQVLFRPFAVFRMNFFLGVRCFHL
jgi:hypothetical protein